ncbi:hypothetical protein BC826DRAFT_972490 [Russula brevipes]|nr:hypothetical protein BC826DRAFT_972490 [Russula brevipes]
MDLHGPKRGAISHREYTFWFFSFFHVMSPDTREVPTLVNVKVKEGSAVKERVNRGIRPHLSKSKSWRLRLRTFDGRSESERGLGNVGARALPRWWHFLSVFYICSQHPVTGIPRTIAQGTGANLGREWWRKGGQNCVASYGRSRAPALTRSKCFDATRPTLASPASPNSKSPAASPIDHKSNGSFSTTTGPGAAEISKVP